VNGRTALINALWRLVAEPMGNPTVRASIPAWLLMTIVSRTRSVAQALRSLASALEGLLQKKRAWA
jgi:hypothetical protein